MSIENIQEREPVRVRIAAVTSDDLEGIGNLMRASWLETYPNEEHGVTHEELSERIDKVYSPDTLDRRKALIQNLAIGTTYLVAKVKDTVVGVCRVARAGELDPHTGAPREMNELQTLYVLPEYQNQGVGKQLWEEARQSLDSDRDTMLMVVSYNERAIGFYRGLGFEETDVIKLDEKYKLPSGAIMPLRKMVLRANIKDI